jgi:nucleoredoxin
MKSIRLIPFLSLLLFSAVGLHGISADKVAGKLVNAKGEAAPSDVLSGKPYVLYYFSAHWCPPCRKFTPRLIDFYNNEGGGVDFELVFVSSDRSAKDMAAYMTETGMPWWALAFDAIAGSGLRSEGGPYIPALVLTDESGKVLSSSYDEASQQSRGVDAVVQDLRSLIKSGS